MCTICASTGTDEAKSDAFAMRMMDTLNGAGLAMMISLGHRIGLFDALSRLPSATSRGLAEDTGLSERYVREWLGAMTCGRIVEHDATAQTYRLPAEHARWLSRSAASNNLAVGMQWIAVLGGVESEVADAFRHGQGVPYASYERFHEVMAEESGQSVLAALDERILPLVPELRGWLTDGIKVLDVGCGSGRILMRLAEMFPRSRFVGYDISEFTIAAAMKETHRRGLANVRFECKDAARMTDEAAFDLITTFDAVHDQARPAEVLRNIRRALSSGGVYLCQEIRGESDHAGNLKMPLAPFLYTISTMHCMSVSLANGGPGLGAMWGRRTCRQMLADAGFDDVVMHEPSHDVLNDWYVCRRRA